MGPSICAAGPTITPLLIGGNAGGNGPIGNPGGGGGGGNYYTEFTGIGAAGGSGVVIIRYSDIYGAATGTIGSPTITTAGGYRVYKWTSSGSITF